MKITQDYTSYYENYMSNTVSYFDSFIKIYIAICIILFIFLIYTYIMMYKLFEKLGIKGWKALIPFYNSWLFLEKVGLPPILGVIPGINGIAMLIAYYKYGKSIGKSKLFSILLAIIPPVMLTIIIFGKDKNTTINTYEKNENEQSQLNSYQQSMNKSNNTNIQQLMSKETNEDLYYQQNIVQQKQPNIIDSYGAKPVEQQSINNNPQYNIMNQQTKLQNNQENEFIRCKRCGTNVKRGNSICFICGTKLE